MKHLTAHEITNFDAYDWHRWYSDHSQALNARLDQVRLLNDLTDLGGDTGTGATNWRAEAETLRRASITLSNLRSQWQKNYAEKCSAARRRLVARGVLPL